MKSTRLHPALSVAEELHTESARRERNQFLRAFRQDVIDGLCSSPKTLPCKYLYDTHGSELFDRICELPEYYPTRTEIGILRSCLPEIADLCGTRVQVVEYGSGSGLKTRMLLHALKNPTSCAMVEISECHLVACAAELEQQFQDLEVAPVCADYTKPLTLPSAPAGTTRRVAFFPGSTIGNFHPEEAETFLAMVAETVGAGGALIIGVDLQKDESILCPAYDDAAGVTAAFNRNILTRMNRELGIDLSPDDFYHSAPYNRRLGRIEMHLVARRDLKVRLGSETVCFSKGESIHTENSYKYTLRGFSDLADDAGWHVAKVWRDEAKRFSVQYLTVK